jgi:FtsP/CotA-like multicopper oxidase with cupredoxin domain
MRMRRREMNKPAVKNGCLSIAILAMLGLMPVATYAVVDGIGGTTFNLTAKAGTIYMGDGGVAYMWGFASGNGPMQYPGPTLILNQGETITVNLTNQLSVPVSILFPGQNVGAVAAAGVGQPGLLTLEARPGETIT